MNARQIMTAVCVACAGSTAGCGDDEVLAAVPGVDTGTLLQRWSIEGTQDIEKCTAYGADRMRIVVYDEKADVYATELAPCADFEKRLTLRAQPYTASATFVDVAGEPVSKTLQLPPFTIANATTTPLQIDFPADAMRR